MTMIRAWRAYCRDTLGAAAVEFALVLVLLIVSFLNVIDLGIYVFDRMQLDTAAQSAAQVAWQLCATAGKVPATAPANHCSSSLVFQMTYAAQRVSLGTGVTLNAPADYFCCPGSGGAPLSCSAQITVTTPTPAACSSGDPPGDYIQVTASYTYAPLFSGISVASVLTTPITRVSYMRLD